MPSLDSYIDLHCERVQDGLFQEPLNTLSNLFILAAAYYLYKDIKAKNIKSLAVKTLVILIGLISLGSTTFHMTARMWGAILDVLPIAIFSLIFIYSLCHRIFTLTHLQSVLAIGAFFVYNVFFKSLSDKMPDGYISLFPSVMVLCILSLYAIKTQNPSADSIAKATLIAFIASCFRALDTYMNTYDLCHYFPIGTHFLWHSLMGLFLYITAKELISRRAIRSKAANNTP